MNPGRYHAAAVAKANLRLTAYREKVQGFRTPADLEREDLDRRSRLLAGRKTSLGRESSGTSSE